MTGTVGALYRFFSSFGLDAYAEGDVPDNETPPYLTVQLVEPSVDAAAPTYARLYYRGASYEPVLAKADEIGRAIGTGVTLRMDGGAVHVWKGQTFAQIMSQDVDRAIKCVYLSMIIQVDKE